MLALLMCGGQGKRLGVGEKPLFKVCGKRLVDHALTEIHTEVVAVTSPYTPKTERYLRELGVEIYRASGKSFVEDYMEACIEMQIVEPVLIVSSDIVYLKRGLIDDVIDFYLKSEKMALKVVKGDLPVGINVIDAFFIDYSQEEEIYIIGENDIINVNTMEDAKRAERLWTCMRKKERG